MALHFSADTSALEFETRAAFGDWLTYLQV